MTNDQSSMNGQNSQKGMNGQNAMNSGPAGMQIRQSLKDDLSKAGFSDIQIMPESFLVQAKDSQRNPVIMMINPYSVTAITEETQTTNPASNAAHGATGNANSNNTNTNNNGATPGPSSTGGSQPVTPGGGPKP